MTKQQDYLPEAERHKPPTPEDALLAFGEIGDPEEPLYQPATGTLPGTPERIEVYRQRALRREPIFNPHDRNDCTGSQLNKPARQSPITAILRQLEKRNDK
jgi:hypothetical protein